MILGEIHPDKIIILLTELCTRSDRDIGLDAAELDKLEDVYLQRREPQEEIAAALRRTCPAAGTAINNLHQIIPDTLMLGNTLLHPTLRLREPVQKRGLAVTGAAQRDHSLKLLHPGNDLRIAVAHAQAETAEGLRLGGANDGNQLIGLLLQSTQMGIGLLRVKDLPTATLYCLARRPIAATSSGE